MNVRKLAEFSLLVAACGLPAPGFAAVAAGPDAPAAVATMAGSLQWPLVAGFLLLFMQAGFAMVESGLCRAKNAAHTISMNLMIFPLACIAFWAYGFALGWGNSAHSPSPPGFQVASPGMAALDRGLGFGPVTDAAGRPAGYAYGLVGTKGFFLNGLDEPATTLFFVAMGLLSVTAAVATGSMVERWSWRNFCLYGLWIALPFGIWAHWIWGGGWLARIGATWHLGHGVVDFAGSGAVHAMGGIIALAGTMLLGPRLGKYREGRPNPIPGHNVPMVVTGTFVLWLGWFGVTAAAGFASGDNIPATVSVNLVLASAAGALTAMITLRMKRIKPDPTIMCNGVLAGLVAISASCAYVDTWAALLTGGVAGVLVVFSVFFWEKRRIDDPVGAISVHGVNGLWGMLALGLFANGRHGVGLNGVDRIRFTVTTAKTASVDGVRGLFYGDASQFAAQLIGAVTLLVFAYVMAYLWFRFSNRYRPMRVSRETELMGLDAPEMGALGYPDFTVTNRS